MTEEFDIPSLPRAVDYLLGGAANGPADRQAAERACAAWPSGDLRVELRAARSALGRMVGHLVGDAGLGQLLHIGAGLPTMGSTHEVAQRAAPATRVVYVDRDPAVVDHARRLLRQQPRSPTAYVQGELDDPDQVLRDATGTLDLSRPVGLLLFGALHELEPADDPAGLVRLLVDAVPSGSWVALGHLAEHELEGPMDAALELIVPGWGARVVRRDRAGVAALLGEDLELVPPGVAAPGDWRPEPSAVPAGASAMWCAVARKP
ncbi:SAM-dependent methyltransferase [Kitasatospora sp. NPDC057015]|uniref:SAM-dependent methyltransferase n=1 Tax=Kitasatospora sp. NPDC057015 TaxID=3346001 RepID=UPI003641D648